jgi:hypothetical protein
MSALFGCDDVQGELYLLAGLSADEIRTEHARTARHLGWCHACRTRAAEVLAVERAAARGEIEPLLAPIRGEWRDVAGRAGERARELVGRLVAEVRRAGAVFTELPGGVLAFPMPATAGALRGPEGAPEMRSAPTLGQRVRFALGDSDTWAELTLESEGDRIRVALTFAGGDATRRSVHLRELYDDRSVLVARHTVRGEEPLILKDLRPGRYLVEVREQAQARRFQLRFDIEPSA